MKIKFLFLMLLIIVLTSCSAVPKENEAVLVQSTTSVETYEQVAKGNYYVGDRIFSMKIKTLDPERINCSDCRQLSSYYFGGFVDEDTLIVNVHLSPGYSGSTGFPFYFTFKNGSIIKLPFTNMRLNVLDYNIQENTVVFEQLK